MSLNVQTTLQNSLHFWLSVDRPPSELQMTVDYPVNPPHTHPPTHPSPLHHAAGSEIFLSTLLRINTKIPPTPHISFPGS